MKLGEKRKLGERVMVIKQYIRDQSQRVGTEVKAFALHWTDPSLIPGTAYSSLSTSSSAP